MAPDVAAGYQPERVIMTASVESSREKFMQDACQSGAGRRVLAATSKPSGEQMDLAPCCRRRSCAFLASQSEVMPGATVPSPSRWSRRWSRRWARAGKRAQADLRGDGKLTTSALDYYVSERVKALTGGSQSPVMVRPATVPDFPIAFAR
jgi:hypothetical protein